MKFLSELFKGFPSNRAATTSLMKTITWIKSNHKNETKYSFLNYQLILFISFQITISQLPHSYNLFEFVKISSISCSVLSNIIFYFLFSSSGVYFISQCNQMLLLPLQWTVSQMCELVLIRTHIPACSLLPHVVTVLILTPMWRNWSRTCYLSDKVSLDWLLISQFLLIGVVTYGDWKAPRTA